MLHVICYTLHEIMKLGIKIGPNNNWKQILEETNAKYVEVWFRLEWLTRYKEIFSYLNTHVINYGLHFWHVLDGGIDPNLVYEKNGIAQATEEAMARTIDIAEKYGAYYVNIHPGSLILRKLDLDKMKTTVLSDQKISLDQAMETLKKRTIRLNKYAQAKNILFLVETLPKNEASHWNGPSGRDKIQQAQNLPLEAVLNLIDLGMFITNDIGHTLASEVSQNRQFLWDRVMNFSKRTALYTKLIHLNTVVPPFNGTDSHNGVLEEDFKQNVLPNKEQLKEFLNLFKDRDDVWLIPEPKAEKMVENYVELKKILY